MSDKIRIRQFSVPVELQSHLGSRIMCADILLWMWWNRSVAARAYLGTQLYLMQKSWCGWVKLPRLCIVFFGMFVKFWNWLLASSCLSLRLEQLGFYWTNSHEIWFWELFENSL